jgi:NADH-quinone oxidoreductase subunit I
MKQALKEIITGFNSLLVGLRITLGQFFKRSVTLQYPHEALKMTPRYRGHIELVGDPETGQPLCIACKVCEKACPSDCILVEGVKPAGAKRKMVTQFTLNFTTCSLCGSCIEACKTDAIQFSREYNLAGTCKADFLMDLVKRLAAQPNPVPLTPAAPAIPAMPATTSTAPKPATTPAPPKPAAPQTTPKPIAPSTPAAPQPSVTAEVK